MNIRKYLRDSRRVPKAGRVWFWKPQWHWFGWKTLVPFTYGHDEYARRVLCIGWSVTGRVLIAVWYCGDRECLDYAIANPYDEKDFNG